MPRPAPVGGRRSKQLRTALRTVRTGRPSTTRRSAQSDLLPFVKERYTDPEDTTERLRALLAALEERDDRRAVFLSIYSQMTAAVADRVDRGDFADPEWVGDYLVAFANHYRRAVRDYEAGSLDDVPDPWQLAFDAGDRGDTLLVQDAALGVNAHINYDLAYALDDVGTSPDTVAKYQDHSAIADVIRAVVDDAQQSLVERDAAAVETLDDSLGRFDEWVTVLTIDECRDSAWRTAKALDSRFGPRRWLACWLNDVTATGAAYAIMDVEPNGLVSDARVDAA